MNEMVIESTIKSLQWIYAIVIALSIGEAFKQFVPVPNTDMEKCRIQWDRLPSLAALLILVVPFYYGMTRYFCEMYYAHGTDASYGKWLLFDCAAFTVEAGLFFVLARSLSSALWWRFNGTIVALLCLDIVWGVFVWNLHQCPMISPWVIVNVCAVPLLVGVYMIFRNRATRLPLLASCGVLVVLLARTLADYWAGWEFYFPKVVDVAPPYSILNGNIQNVI